MEISDRVTILRKGESVATVETKQTNAKELTELMVGHSVDLSIERPVVEDKTKDVLQVDNLTIFDEDGVKVITHVLCANGVKSRCCRCCRIRAEGTMRGDCRSASCCRRIYRIQGA